MRSMKLFGLVVAFVVVGSAMGQTPVPTDVPANHWAAPAVSNLYRLGILQGYPDGSFKGSRPASRYELALTLQRAFADLQKQGDALKGDLSVLKQARAEVSLEELALARKQLDTLRAEFGDQKRVSAEVQGLTQQFADLANRMQEMRATLKAMRSQLPASKLK